MANVLERSQALVDALGVNEAPVVDSTPTAFSSGLRQGALDMGSKLQSFAGGTARAAGFNEFAARRDAQAKALEEEAQQAGPRVQQWGDVHGMRDFWDYGTGMAGGLAPALGVGIGAGALTAATGGGALAGLAAGTAAFAPVEIGDTLARQQRETGQQDYGRAVLGGTAASAAMNVVPAAFGGALFGQGVKAGGKAAASQAAKAAEAAALERGALRAGAGVPGNADAAIAQNLEARAAAQRALQERGAPGPQPDNIAIAQSADAQAAAARAMREQPGSYRAPPIEPAPRPPVAGEPGFPALEPGAVPAEGLPPIQPAPRPGGAPVEPTAPIQPAPRPGEVPAAEGLRPGLPPAQTTLAAKAALDAEKQATAAAAAQQAAGRAEQMGLGTRMLGGGLKDAALQGVGMGAGEAAKQWGTDPNKPLDWEAIQHAGASGAVVGFPLGMGHTAMRSLHQNKSDIVQGTKDLAKAGYEKSKGLAKTGYQKGKEGLAGAAAKAYGTPGEVMDVAPGMLGKAGEVASEIASKVKGKGAEYLDSLKKAMDRPEKIDEELAAGSPIAGATEQERAVLADDGADPAVRQGTLDQIGARIKERTQQAASKIADMLDLDPETRQKAAEIASGVYDAGSAAWVATKKQALKAQAAMEETAHNLGRASEVLKEHYKGNKEGVSDFFAEIEAAAEQGVAATDLINKTAQEKLPGWTQKLGEALRIATGTDPETLARREAMGMDAPTAERVARVAKKWLKSIPKKSERGKAEGEPPVADTGTKFSEAEDYNPEVRRKIGEAIEGKVPPEVAENPKVMRILGDQLKRFAEDMSQYVDSPGHLEDQIDLFRPYFGKETFSVLSGIMDAVHGTGDPAKTAAFFANAANYKDRATATDTLESTVRNALPPEMSRHVPRLVKTMVDWAEGRGEGIGADQARNAAKHQEFKDKLKEIFGNRTDSVLDAVQKHVEDEATRRFEMSHNEGHIVDDEQTTSVDEGGTQDVNPKEAKPQEKQQLFSGTYKKNKKTGEEIPQPMMKPELQNLRAPEGQVGSTQKLLDKKKRENPDSDVRWVSEHEEMGSGSTTKGFIKVTDAPAEGEMSIHHIRNSKLDQVRDKDSLARIEIEVPEDQRGDYGINTNTLVLDAIRLSKQGRNTGQEITGSDQMSDKVRMVRGFFKAYASLMEQFTKTVKNEDGTETVVGRPVLPNGDKTVIGYDAGKPVTLEDAFKLDTTTAADRTADKATNRLISLREDLARGHMDVDTYRALIAEKAAIRRMKEEGTQTAADRRRFAEITDQIADAALSGKDAAPIRKEIGELSVKKMASPHGEEDILQSVERRLQKAMTDLGETVNIGKRDMTGDARVRMDEIDKRMDTLSAKKEYSEADRREMNDLQRERRKALNLTLDELTGPAKARATRLDEQIVKLREQRDQLMHQQRMKDDLSMEGAEGRTAMGRDEQIHRVAAEHGNKADQEPLGVRESDTEALDAQREAGKKRGNIDPGQRTGKELIAAPQDAPGKINEKPVVARPMKRDGKVHMRDAQRLLNSDNPEVRAIGENIEWIAKNIDSLSEVDYNRFRDAMNPTDTGSKEFREQKLASLTKAIDRKAVEATMTKPTSAQVDAAVNKMAAQQLADWVKANPPKMRTPDSVGPRMAVLRAKYEPLVKPAEGAGASVRAREEPDTTPLVQRGSKAAVESALGSQKLRETGAFTDAQGREIDADGNPVKGSGARVPEPRVTSTPGKIAFAPADGLTPRQRAARDDVNAGSSGRATPAGEGVRPVPKSSDYTGQARLGLEGEGDTAAGATSTRGSAFEEGRGAPHIGAREVHGAPNIGTEEGSVVNRFGKTVEGSGTVTGDKPVAHATLPGKVKTSDGLTPRQRAANKAEAAAAPPAPPPPKAPAAKVEKATGEVRKGPMQNEQFDSEVFSGDWKREYSPKQFEMFLEQAAERLPMLRELHAKDPNFGMLGDRDSNAPGAAYEALMSLNKLVERGLDVHADLEFGENTVSKATKDKLQAKLDAMREGLKEGPNRPKAEAAKKAALEKAASSYDQELIHEIRTTDDASALQKSVNHLTDAKPVRTDSKAVATMIGDAARHGDVERLTREAQAIRDQLQADVDAGVPGAVARQEIALAKLDSVVEHRVAAMGLTKANEIANRMLAKGGKLGDVLEAIEPHLPPRLQAVARAIRESGAGDTAVGHFKAGEAESYTHMGTYHGEANYNERLGRYNTRGVRINPENKHFSATVLLHEGVHAATMKGLHADVAFHHSINDLMADLKTKEPMLGMEYGMKNAEEFMAEAMTNPAFQERLQAISMGGKRTMWDRVVEAVRNFLGLDARHDSALRQALDMTTRAMEKTREEINYERTVEEANARLDELMQDPDNAYESTLKYSHDSRADWMPGNKRDVKGVMAELHRVLGDTIGVDVHADLGKGVAGSWNPVKNLLEISAKQFNVKSVAYHESLHAFFTQLYRAGNDRVAAVLMKAAQSGHVQEQLREYFRDQPAVLRSIMRDPEEAAAYMYQLWRQGNLKMNPQATTIFRKISEWVHKTLGIWTNDQRALEVMEHFSKGDFAKDVGQVNTAALMKKGTNPAYEAAKSMFSPAMDLGERVFASGSSRLRDMGFPAVDQIADLVKTKLTARKTDPGYMAAARQEHAQRMNQLANDIGDISPATQKETMAALQGGVPATSVEAKVTVQIIREYMHDMLNYIDPKGKLAGGLGPDYFTRVWDADAISKNPKAFLSMLQHYSDKGMLKADPLDVMRRLVSNDGNDFTVDTRMPGFQAGKERGLKFISDEHAAPFLNKDLYKTLNDYTSQATRRTEFARRFGENGEKLTAMLEQAQREGATPDQIKQVETYLKGINGSLGDGINPLARRWMGNMAVYQNIRLLPLAPFSSVVDPLGIALRGGTMKDAWNTFKRIAVDIPKVFKDSGVKDWQTKLAETLGVVENATLMHAVGAMYTQGMVGNTARRINDTFFKYNLMETINRSSRIGATEASLKFMQRHAEEPNQHSTRYFDELGLHQSDIQINPVTGRVKTTVDEGLTQEHADRMRMAVHQWVDGAVLRPDNADRPVWFNDPHFMLVSHLKSFTYSFHHTIIDRVLHEAKHGNYQPMAVMASYVPVMIVADYMKGMIQGGGDQPAWKKGWGPSDYLWSGVQRGGLLGVGQFGADVAEGMRRGHSGLGSLSGPTLEQLGDAIDVAGGRQRFGTFALDAMPANALYSWAFKGGGPVRADPHAIE